ncbi:MAG: efflux RND transporter periplasmic adaptor subunit [Hyphomicrobiaceae bacterium]|nr:efflux RND transporter periplasmic adaptor subunit [Hyphomicrobiaceae bacterium]
MKNLNGTTRPGKAVRPGQSGLAAETFGGLFATMALAFVMTLGQADVQADEAIGAMDQVVAVKRDSVPVVIQTIIDDKAVFATVRSTDKAEARARLSGTIVDLKIDEGSQVKVGQQIGTIVDDKLKLQMVSLDARIKSASARWTKARGDLKRGRSLKRRGVIASSKLAELQAAYDVANSDLKSAKAERSVLVEQVRQGKVLAPANGRVLKVHVTKGSVILAGESLATIAANQYILRLELPERHARFIKKGEQVMVGARGLDPVEKAVGVGIISQVYPELQNGRVVADVEIASLGDYFVGERAQVRIAADKRRAIVIPKGYSFRRYGLDYVLLDQKREKPLEIVVQLGEPVLLGKGKGGVEVLAGLRSGDFVVRP